MNNKKVKKFKELSDDIDSEIFDNNGEKLEGEYEIESIIDVFTDPKDITSVSENFGINQDLSVKEVKRGNTIWITALLRKPGTTSFTSPAVQGILKLRIVDIYYGLQYLSKVINK